ncbi:MAG: hypothetical protein AB7F28_04990 [Candidatus Margulisiibacteriota bacterium]
MSVGGVGPTPLRAPQPNPPKTPEPARSFAPLETKKPAPAPSPTYTPITVKTLGGHSSDLYQPKFTDGGESSAESKQSAQDRKDYTQQLTVQAFKDRVIEYQEKMTILSEVRKHHQEREAQMATKSTPVLSEESTPASQPKPTAFVSAETLTEKRLKTLEESISGLQKESRLKEVLNKLLRNPFEFDIEASFLSKSKTKSSHAKLQKKRNQIQADESLFFSWLTPTQFTWALIILAFLIGFVFAVFYVKSA